MPRGVPFETVQVDSGPIIVHRRSLPDGTALTGLYCVKAEGDSLVGDGVLDGDYLIVEREAPFINSKIYIVRLEGKDTCARHVYKSNNIVRLVSSGRNIEELLPLQARLRLPEGRQVGQVELLGRVIAKYRAEML